MISWDEVAESDLDVGLNNLIARAVSPGSPRPMVEKVVKDEMPHGHSGLEISQLSSRYNSSQSGRDTPSSNGRDTPSSLSGRDTPVEKPRYQLWPSVKKAFNGRRSPDTESEMTLHPSQSTPILRREASSDSIGRMRAGSLPRRRKMSIPELSLAPMTTVQERPTDSPTIPGLFPVHERSNSAPTHAILRSGLLASTLSPVADNSTVTTPTQKPTLLQAPPLDDGPKSAKSIKRASSILLPDDDPTIIPLLPQTVFKPGVPEAGSALSRRDSAGTPPAVPPKSPRLKLRIPPIPANLGARANASESANRPVGPATAVRTPATSSMPTQAATPPAKVSPNPFTMNWTSPEPSNRPFASPDRGQSPLTSASTTSNFSHKHNISNTSTALTTPMSAQPPLARSNSISNMQRERSNSNGNIQNFSYRHRREESDSSIMDRGRPTKRLEGLVKRKLTSKYAAPDTSFGSLPNGITPECVLSQWKSEEAEKLNRQARRQAEKFEVLPQKDVKALTRELHSLDERCDYLRKTHNSLRDGRRELHARMIAYLKSPRLAKFSLESMLRQETALAELDRSIDEWVVKLEYAENRRSRVRQKLLEHIAAALIIPSAKTPNSATFVDEQTPPRSPEKEESPRATDRCEVESIKIYAGSEVYALLADIEQEIENMVEA